MEVRIWRFLAIMIGLGIMFAFIGEALQLKLQFFSYIAGMVTTTISAIFWRGSND